MSVFEEFEEGLKFLITTTPRNSTKNKLIKDWFKNNYNSNGRISVVNEAKQAYNRAQEQLSKKDADHVIFFITDPAAFNPIVNKCETLIYDSLKSLLFLSYEFDGLKFSFGKALLQVLSEDESLIEFYRSNIPDLEVQYIESNHHVHSNESVSSYVSQLDEDDITLDLVKELHEDGYSGVIFSGPPGTGKSWYARNIALTLSPHVFFVQFHPNYQYEDFIEAYRPNEKGGFELEKKTLLNACDKAIEHPNDMIIIVIDELSRTDAVRVFGEALTYIENDKRDLEFTLASGRITHIPKNIFFICTMNPWDKGVDELDYALERRFAKIGFAPDINQFKIFIDIPEINDKQKLKLERFFYLTSRHPNPMCHIGHCYFKDLNSIDRLKRLWLHQLDFHFKKVLQYDEKELSKISTSWADIFVSDGEE